MKNLDKDTRIVVQINLQNKQNCAEQCANC